ncbi:IclR family transcriptional regulator [Salicibibacter cibarius]|uniref:IclR family transcriptional regulator n=1 Tax=Salicibibacter cibarius TaxID=2743000 RepID=A0A7T7CA64_9BACI|nr:IclR family transcriptional regulator [Salicibibacter cibarius]QQK74389.1 IclR family transcriptional regulator [Salicibibacter cibarius]
MISSITNAIRIMNCFSIKSAELGVSELADLLKMNKSTVHHAVKSLYEEGVLIRTKNRKYRLGSKILSWGEVVSYQYQPYFDALPYLNDLVNKTNEVAHLAVEENEDVSYLIKVEPKVPLKIQTSVGSRKPLFCTAVGKVLLSNSFTDNDIYKLELKKITQNTITSHESLIQEMRKIREQDYAIDDQEYEDGLFCISSPVRDFMGEVICAISISGPEVRIKKEKDNYINYVLKIAREISANCDF